MKDILKPKKIETYKDLPEYGTCVLVCGIDYKQYGLRDWHVCEMDDLEDGLEFAETGKFYWLTENGTEINDVTHWCELPEFPEIENDWISVEERIPETEDYYAVRFKDDEEDEKPFRIRPNQNILGFMSGKEITHWKFLRNK